MIGDFPIQFFICTSCRYTTYFELGEPVITSGNIKSEKCVKYANEMADDVIHSTQHYIKYINRDILAKLQHRPLKLGRLIVLQETHLLL